MVDLKMPAGTAFDPNRAEYCISAMFDAAGKTGCQPARAAARAQVDEGGRGCRARGADGERGERYCAQDGFGQQVSRPSICRFSSV